MCELVSDFIGKPLCTRQGDCIGYIKNAQVNKTFRRIRNFEWCDNEEEEHLLPCSAVLSCGDGAVVVKGKTTLPIADCIPLPFGKPIYTARGAALGYAADFVCDGLCLTELLTRDGTRIPTDTVRAAGDVLLIGTPLKRTTRAKTKTPNISAVKNDKPAVSAVEQDNSPILVAERDEPTVLANKDEKQTVSSPERDDSSILAAERDKPTVSVDEQDEPFERKQVIQQKEEKSPVNEGISCKKSDTVPAFLPQKAKRCVGQELLTGKQLPSDIRDVHGVLLAAKGSRVNADIIKRCTAHGKLFELTLLCCKNSVYFERQPRNL